MRNPHPPKLSERQQLSRRRRRALTLSASVLAAMLFGSWLSLHALSEDALPGWLRAPSAAATALAALLPGTSSDAATRAGRVRRAVVPLAAPAKRTVPKPALARDRVASTGAAHGPVLGTSGDASATESVPVEGTTVAANVDAAAQPSQPLIDPAQPVDPTDPVPGAPVPTPEDVPSVLDGVGDTVGDVVGGLLPDDFSLNLAPRVGDEALGVGADVGVTLGGESGVQADVGAEVNTPVTPVAVDAEVALGSTTQVDLGLGTALGSTTVGVGPSSGVVAQADLGVGSVEANVPLSGSQASLAVGVNLLGIEVEQPVNLGSEGKGGPLVELPNLGIGLLGTR
jgi:hypothetical protein